MRGCPLKRQKGRGRSLKPRDGGQGANIGCRNISICAARHPFRLSFQLPLLSGQIDSSSFIHVACEATSPRAATQRLASFILHEHSYARAPAFLICPCRLFTRRAKVGWIFLQLAFKNNRWERSSIQQRTCPRHVHVDADPVSSMLQQDTLTGLY